MSSSANSDSVEKGHVNHLEGLSRQMTVSLSPDQYERLFFQPTASKGDLDKRLGNPTLLGLMGFLIPFTSSMFAVLTFQGSSPLSLTAFSGTFYFFGGIAMVLAGLGEFVLGNTFPMSVFMVYGVHWVYQGYLNDPVHAITASYAVGDVPGALSQAYNAGQGHYNVVLALITFCFLCGSLRTNVPFVIIFFTLIILFGFFAAGYYQLGYDPTAAGVEHAFKYFKIAGGFGFVTLVMGWYLAIIQACISTGVPCPLPVFDLSSKLFVNSKRGRAEEHAGSVQVPANTV